MRNIFMNICVLQLRNKRTNPFKNAKIILDSNILILVNSLPCSIKILSHDIVFREKTKIVLMNHQNSWIIELDHHCCEEDWSSLLWNPSLDILWILIIVDLETLQSELQEWVM